MLYFILVYYFLYLYYYLFLKNRFYLENNDYFCNIKKQKVVNYGLFLCSCTTKCVFNMNVFSVSIIIPVYHVEEFIERCIMSVINQTYDHSKIECILVDDCGTDKSISMAQECIDKYKGSIRFQIIHNKFNCGQSESRNNGLKIASGRYVFFLDSDDYITPDCINKLMEIVRSNPEVEAVMANHIDKRDDKSIPTNKIPSRIIRNRDLMKLFFLTYIPCMVWNVLISRDLIERNHLRFKPGIVYEDILWSFKLFKEVNSFVFIPDITLIYELNPHSTVNAEQKEDEHRIKSRIAILNEIFDNIDYRNYEGIIIYMTTMLLGLIDRMRRNNDDDIILEEVFLIRNKILKRTIFDCRLVLLAFVLIMYHPINYIIHLRCFRNGFQRLSHCVFIIASFFAPLHVVYRHNKCVKHL